MKIAVIMTGLSVAVTIVLISQALRQEYNLHHMKARMLEDSAVMRTKEEAIVKIKNKMKDVKMTLSSVENKLTELKKQKEDFKTQGEELEKNLQTCNTEQGDALKKQTETTEAIAKLKADHEAAKAKAQTDIQSLKQQILDRDKAICAFADTTKEEAQKLCGVSEATK
ncbi:uncharacterized protein si:dkey-87o1.2 [Acanthopagrus latus]|uniref:uncharacterized protein si:dkey-87o1.2 n=1 Tax=Acanthopagrus latus TaxID=8177 RepID=UPI00187BD29D|nr:uncharacterized protein si:dkey-87o1.2 [Acanthopagrus latus]